MNSFYPKLALNNIKKNAQVYVPYLVASVLIIAMFYIMGALAHTENISYRGNITVSALLNFGMWVVAIFSLIIIFYINGFLMRRRQKELGLYHILGMNKQHIAYMMVWETLFIIGFILLGGLTFGILLSKLMHMILVSMAGISTPISMRISEVSLVITMLIYGISFGLTLLYNLVKIRLVNPINLLKEGQKGEKEPKTRWIMAALGGGLLGWGYYIAVTAPGTAMPWELIPNFLQAVLMVIGGTYLLFIAGITVILKALRKKKKIYYHPRYFSVISGMLYRMKQHGAGLASICILSTMVLVTLTTTASIYLGIDDTVRSRHTHEYHLRFVGSDPETKSLVTAALSENFQSFGIDAPNINKTNLMFRSGFLVDDEIQFDSREHEGNFDEATRVLLNIFDEAYLGKHGSLAHNEAWVTNWEHPTITIDGHEFMVRELPEESSQLLMRFSNQLVIILSDLNLFYEQGFNTEWQFDLGLSRAQSIAFAEALRMHLAGRGTIGTQSEDRVEMMALFGGLLFVGIFVGVLFMLNAGLIVYYKQVSEGYEDKARFIVMQKVGMSKEEVKKTINIQVRIMFFLPLVMATTHLAFSFNIIQSFLRFEFHASMHLFIWCTIVTLIIFTIIYRILYHLTAKTYYRIVDYKTSQ